jgi:hypothetical protein
MLPFRAGEDRAHGLPRGRSGGKRPRPAMAVADYFPSAGKPTFTSRGKIVCPSPSSADASALRFAAGAGPVRPPPFVAMKAAMGAVDPPKASTP